GPYRHQAIGVERENDERDDRGVEEDETEGGDDGEEPALAQQRRPSTTAFCARCMSMIGTTTMTSMVMASAAARGQLVFEKNSAHSTRPIICVPGPPSSEGMTNSPMAGRNTSMAPAITPGMESGSV